MGLSLDWADLLFDGAWASINELLGIHKAKTGDGLDSLDDGDFAGGSKSL